MDILDANVCCEEASINLFISGYSEQRFRVMLSPLLSNEVFSVFFFFGYPKDETQARKGSRFFSLIPSFTPPDDNHLSSQRP